MCFNPGSAPSAIKAICASARRKVDLHDIFQELAYRTRVDNVVMSGRLSEKGASMREIRVKSSRKLYVRRILVCLAYRSI